MLETDPIDLLLGDDDDIVIDETTNDLSLSSGLIGVAQSAKIACRFIRGEHFANLSIGIPYFERDGIVDPSEALIGQKFSKPKMIDAFREALSEVDGVNTIKKLAVTFDPRTRVATPSWILSTEFGDTIEDSREVIL